MGHSIPRVDEHFFPNAEASALPATSCVIHPAVTAAIIGPRTMDQLESQLSGAEVTLSADILDRIDELVAPGVTINPDDNSYGEAELVATARRRNT